MIHAKSKDMSSSGGSYEGGSYEGGSYEGGSYEGGSYEGGSYDGGSYDKLFADADDEDLLETATTMMTMMTSRVAPSAIIIEGSFSFRPSSHPRLTTEPSFSPSSFVSFWSGSATAAGTVTCASSSTGPLEESTATTLA